MPAVPVIEALATQELDRFFDQNFMLVLVLAVVLVALYVTASRLVHATVPRMLDAQAGDLEDGGVQATELLKRAETLEALTTTLIRVAALSGLFLLFIGIFGLWSLLTGVALLLAAVTLAGQSIVLDYIMGILIVVEGTFFKGDNIKFNEMFGDVEDVGLRRTVIRGPDGTVHSISNGELRVVSNRTRIHAAAEVKVRGIREEDLDAIIEIAERVGREVAEDAAFSADVMEAHTLRFVENPDDLGVTAIFRGQVVAASRWRIGTEVRRRLNRELLAADIELNKRGVAPRLPRSGGGAQPPYVPEPGEGDD
jgi:small conductance mechanosensitive channel